MLRIINYIYTFVSHAEKALIFVEIGQFVRFSSDFRYMETMKDRIRKIMELESSTPSRFAESIGIQRAAMSHILSGRNNPSLDVIMKVHQKYNYVKLEWLLYGQGNISEESIQSASDFQPSLFAENAIIPPNGTVTPENRREMPLESSQNTPKEIVKQEIRYIEKPSRKITEIRIFFDDNTYETFRGEK